MTAWPVLRDTITVRPARHDTTVVRCGLTDTMLADAPVALVVFFRHSLDVARLADGLSVALAQVPVFGGRLREAPARLEIACGDAGVPLTVYDVGESLGDAIGRAALAGSGYVDHVTGTAGVGDAPLLTVRVSRLADGATALGVSWQHTVGDLHSFGVLLRAWSAAVDGLPLPDVHLVTDRDAYVDAVLPAADCGTPGFRLPEPDDAAAVRREFATAVGANRAVQLYFGAAEVNRMRQKFSADAGVALTANDVVCAHLAATIRALDGDPADRFLVLPVDVRRHLGLPDGSVGNLLGELHLPCPGTGTPQALAAAIHTAVADFAGSHLNLRSNHEFLATIGEHRLRECVPIGFDPLRRTLTVSNWTRLGGYDVTFGGEQPVLVAPAPNPPLPWTAWLVEGFDGTGILCTVVLPARLAARLRGAAGRDAVHRYREPGDAAPDLAGAVRKLV